MTSSGEYDGISRWHSNGIMRWRWHCLRRKERFVGVKRVEEGRSWAMTPAATHSCRVILHCALSSILCTIKRIVHNQGYCVLSRVLCTIKSIVHKSEVLIFAIFLLRNIALCTITGIVHYIRGAHIRKYQWCTCNVLATLNVINYHRQFVVQNYKGSPVSRCTSMWGAVSRCWRGCSALISHCSRGAQGSQRPLRNVSSSAAWCYNESCASFYLPT